MELTDRSGIGGQVAWKMSHDYVAIVISVDAALLLIGTLQYGAAFRRMIATLATVIQKTRDDHIRIFGELRQGTGPSPSDLLVTFPTSKLRIMRLMSPKQLAAGFVTTGLYSGWCMLMVTLMSSLIEWAGTADAGASPELAKRAFWVTSLSLFALLAEVYLLVAFEGFQKVKAAQSEAVSVGTPEEWARIAELTRDARAATQGSPATSGPSPGQIGSAPGD
ncbi:hypothetical protein [Streptomyces sp. NE06-03C]|uniref:hypothetical protein n=1 Tax=Streptomyces sp. NE06-03C TaxID=3028694 RepID=UPI0029ADD1FF|nr:hypothetical protein [Streptomyces sp. NE06-03C]MDX2917291.1 hypothetical protein [Streptomyces sp. NE06-03C]